MTKICNKTYKIPTAVNFPVAELQSLKGINGKTGLFIALATVFFQNGA